MVVFNYSEDVSGIIFFCYIYMLKVFIGYKNKCFFVLVDIEKKKCWEIEIFFILIG